MTRQPWTVPPDWAGETAYIVAGGPSVAALDLSALEDRRVIAVNSSYEVAPFADYLIFADARWWQAHRDRLDGFAGRIVAVSSAARDHGSIRLLRLKRSKPADGLPAARDTVPLARTTTTAAIGLAVHLGATRIVLIGVDQRRGPDGRCHHHAPHQWKNKPGDTTWDRQLPQIKALAGPLEERGIAVINASPVSRIDWWPKKALADIVAGDPMPGEAAHTAAPSGPAAPAGEPPGEVTRQYAEPIRAGYAGDAARDYERARAATRKWRAETRGIERLIAGMPAGATVLDVPVGTGRFLPAYARRGLKVIGIDASPDMLAEARARADGGDVDLREGDARSLALADASVDHAVCTRFLNWLNAPDLTTVLSELERVTRGDIIVTVRLHGAGYTRPNGIHVHGEAEWAAALAAAELAEVSRERIHREGSPGDYWLARLKRGASA